MEDGDVIRLTEAISKLNNNLDRLNTGGSNSHASINTGGMWISVTCVIILLVICFFQNRDIMEMQRRYERMQDYLSAIYMQAPYLKPKEKT